MLNKTDMSMYNLTTAAFIFTKNSNIRPLIKIDFEKKSHLLNSNQFYYFFII